MNSKTTFVTVNLGNHLLSHNNCNSKTTFVTVNQTGQGNYKKNNRIQKQRLLLLILIEPVVFIKLNAIQKQRLLLLICSFH